MKSKTVILIVESAKSSKERMLAALKKPSKKYAGMTILSFPDYATLGRIISASKLEMLALIRKEKPKSIQQLAKSLKRDFKNVYEDFKVLQEAGLVEAKTTGRGKAHVPKALFQEILLSA